MNLKLNFGIIVKRFLIFFTFFAMIALVAFGQYADSVRIIPQPRHLHVKAGQYDVFLHAAFYCNLPSKEKVDFVH
ncbi:hypothetical protein, partial [Bacteroides heparinolyticus]